MDDTSTVDKEQNSVTDAVSKENDHEKVRNDVLPDDLCYHIARQRKNEYELMNNIIALRKEISELRNELAIERGHTSGENPARDVVHKRQKKKQSWVKEIVFYVILAVLVFTAFVIRSNSEDRPVLVAGFSAFMVKTGSMEDVIPKGSFVITRSTDANKLQVNDDITYMANETTSITHRIIRIEENYQNSGERAFITKGTMNAAADSSPVIASNVVGKVIFHNKILGDIVNFAAVNWPLLIFGAAVLLALFAVLKITLADDKPENVRQKRRRPKLRK